MMEYRKKGPVSINIGKKKNDSSDNTVSNDNYASNTNLSERCAFKHCPNTFYSTPSKIFIPLPKIASYVRSMWLKTIGLETSFAGNEIYCCEDHFDFQKDVKKLSLLKSATSGVQSNLIKSTVIPHVKIHPPQFPSSSANSDNTSAPAPLRIRTIDEVNRQVEPKPGTARGRPLNIVSVSASTQKNRVKKCIVTSCGLTSMEDTKSCHVCVPFSREIRTKWLEAAGLKPKPELFKDTLYVCSIHFEVDELESFATPSLNKHNCQPRKQRYVRAKHGVIPSLRLTKDSNRLRKSVSPNESPPEPDNPPKATLNSLPAPIVVLSRVKLENDENSGYFMVDDELPRRIDLDDSNNVNIKEEDPLAKDPAPNLLPMDDELIERVNSINDPSVRLAFAVNKLHNSDFSKDDMNRYLCPKCEDKFEHRRLVENHVLACEGTKNLSNPMKLLVERTYFLRERLNEVVKHCRVEFENNSVFLNSAVVKQNVPSQSTNDKLAASSSLGSSDAQVVHNGTGDLEDEDVDVEEPKEKNRRKFEITGPKARRGNRGGSSSRRGVKRSGSVRLRNGSDNLDAPPPKSLRKRRKAARFTVKVSDDDELREQDVDDPDFDPMDGNVSRESASNSKSPDSSNQSDSSEIDDENGSHLSEKTIPAKPTVMLNCSICNSRFASIHGLRYHHKVSERCGPKARGTKFKCEACSSIFNSLTLLDEHRALVEACKRHQSEELNILTCPKCHLSFQSLYALRYHFKASVDCSAYTEEISNEAPQAYKPSSVEGTNLTCKGCNVQFNSSVGLGLHLKRSLDCVPDNPDVDIPGVVDRNGSVLLTTQGQSVKINSSRNNEDGDKEEAVYMCNHCFSSFSSIWGLRTHERNSTDCKPGRPYEIPVPQPKSLAEKLKKEYKEKQALLSSKQDDNSSGNSAPKTLMLYTQQVPKEDGKYKCSCNAVFNSIWGYRCHQRMSEKCKTEGSENAIHRTSKKVAISSAAEKSIANGQNICPGCSARFSTPVGLRCHLRNSTVCGADIYTISKTGSSSNSSENTFTCDKCKMELHSIKHLCYHIMTNPNCFPVDVTISPKGQLRGSPGVYLCPCCAQDFKLPASLEQHFIEHAPDLESWTCRECDQVFTDHFVLHRHFHKEHMGQWFCILCYANFDIDVPNISNFKEFYTHVFGVHANGEHCKDFPFKCMICFRSFASKCSLDLHTSSCKKTAEQKFACASCGKVFSKKIHLNSHMRFSHPDVDVDMRYKYKCSKCPQRYMSEKELIVDHAKEGCITAGDTCELCGEVYYYIGGLENHMAVAHWANDRPPSTRRGRPPRVQEPDPLDPLCSRQEEVLYDDHVSEVDPLSVNAADEIDIAPVVKVETDCSYFLDES